MKRYDLLNSGNDGFKKILFKNKKDSEIVSALKKDHPIVTNKKVLQTLNNSLKSGNILFSDKLIEFSLK